MAAGESRFTGVEPAFSNNPMTSFLTGPAQRPVLQRLATTTVYNSAYPRALIGPEQAGTAAATTPEVRVSRMTWSSPVRCGVSAECPDEHKARSIPRNMSSCWLPPTWPYGSRLHVEATRHRIFRGTTTAITKTSFVVRATSTPAIARAMKAIIFNTAGGLLITVTPCVRPGVAVSARGRSPRIGYRIRCWLELWVSSGTPGAHSRSQRTRKLWVCRCSSPMPFGAGGVCWCRRRTSLSGNRLDPSRSPGRRSGCLVAITCHPPCSVLR
jgi:hypothetical protein